jgi:hypothetical protein
VADLRRGGFIAGELESAMALLPWSSTKGNFCGFLLMLHTPCCGLLHIYVHYFHCVSISKVVQRSLCI